MAQRAQWAPPLTELARGLADEFAGDFQQPIDVAERNNIRLGSSALGDNELSSWHALFSKAMRTDKLFDVLVDVHENYEVLRDCTLPALRQYDNAMVELGSRCEDIVELAEKLRKPIHASDRTLRKIEATLAALYSLRSAEIYRERAISSTTVLWTGLSSETLRSLKEAVDRSLAALQLYSEFVQRLGEDRPLDWVSALSGTSIRQEAVSAKTELRRHLETLGDLPHSLE